jgi:hypothetical protein
MISMISINKNLETIVNTVYCGNNFLLNHVFFNDFFNKNKNLKVKSFSRRQCRGDNSVDNGRPIKVTTVPYIFTYI